MNSIAGRNARQTNVVNYQVHVKKCDFKHKLKTNQKTENNWRHHTITICSKYSPYAITTECLVYLLPDFRQDDRVSIDNYIVAAKTISSCSNYTGSLTRTDCRVLSETVVTGTYHLVKRNYTSDLKNLSSDTARQLASEFCSGVSVAAWFIIRNKKILFGVTGLNVVSGMRWYLHISRVDAIVVNDLIFALTCDVTFN